MEQRTNQHLPLQSETLPAQYAPDEFAAASTHKQADAPGTGEKIIFWRDPALSNLELLRATYLTHTFAPHIHEGYAIGIVDKGAERFKYRRGIHVAPEGSIVVINPGEMHTGESATEIGWSYRMLYPAI